MANDLNRCEFIGRLGKDPESRYSPNGDQIVNFSIAVGWKSKDKEGAEWVNISAFGKLAEIISEYCQKGKQVYVAGRFNTQKWQDRESGQDRYSTRIIADTVQLLGGGRDSSDNGSDDSYSPPQRQTSQQQRPAQTGGGRAATSNIMDMDDDIPFSCPRGLILHSI